MILKLHAKFEEKLTCRLENNMRNLTNVHQNTWKFKNWTLMGSFCPKQKIHELKITKELCVMAPKNGQKF